MKKIMHYSIEANMLIFKLTFWCSIQLNFITDFNQIKIAPIDVHIKPGYGYKLQHNWNFENYDVI